MLTTVAIFRDPWEAHLFRTRLETEGLAAFVQYDHRIGVDWRLSFALGGAHVQVVDDEAGAARDVIRRVRIGEFRAGLLDMFGDLDERHCPNCGSLDIRSRPTIAARVLAIALVWFMLMPIPPTARVRTCRTCATRWVE